MCDVQQQQQQQQQQPCCQQWVNMAMMHNSHDT
jgi:hypothetical protein